MGKKKDAVYLGVSLSAATHEELKKLAAEKELSMLDEVANGKTNNYTKRELQSIRNIMAYLTG